MVATTTIDEEVLPSGFHRHPKGGGLVADTAEIGTDVFIGAGSTIGAGSKIGAWSKIGARAEIGEGRTIRTSRDCLVIDSMGSRNAPITITFYPQIEIATGCFIGSIEKFRINLARDHPDDVHTVEYNAALAFIEALAVTRGKEVE